MIAKARHSLALLSRIRIDRVFVQRALMVMAPIMVQQLVSTAFGLVDGVMVGRLGQASVNAVTVANRPTLLFNGLFFGITGGGGILISQYYGAGDRKTCRGIFSLEMLAGLVLALSMCMVMWMAPGWLMRLFTRDPEEVALGVKFLHITCATYLFSAVSMVCLYALRSIGMNLNAMLISAGSLLLNALLNYALIFGKLGAPPMGVEGSALGTAIARGVEMCLYIWFLRRGGSFFRFDVREALGLHRPVVTSLIRRTGPLTVNEIFYALGVILYFKMVAYIDGRSVAAQSIAELATQLGMVLTAGVPSAVGVLVGAPLGAGDFKKALRYAREMALLVGAISLIAALINMLCAYLLPPLYQIEPEVRRMATDFSLVQALLCPINTMFALSFFILRVGGDVRSASILDSLYMWIIPIPLGVILVALGKGVIPVALAYFIIQAVHATRAIPAYYYIKKGQWVRNVTLES